MKLRAWRTPLVAATGLALVLGGASACNSSDSTVTSTPDSKGASAAPADTAGKKAATTAKIGDTITLKGMDGLKMAVTLVKVVPAAKGADEFTAPGSGKHFYGVQFRLRNVGAKGYDDSPSNGAVLIDGQGQQYQADISDISAGPSLSASLKLAPGASSKGFVVFQVPVRTAITKVQFSLDSGLADQAGQWTVGP